MNLSAHDTITPPFDRRAPMPGRSALPETFALVEAQVDALLARSPAVHALKPEEQQRIKQGMNRISLYAAELLRTDFWETQQLGQQPLRKRTTTLSRVDPPVKEPSVKTMSDDDISSHTARVGDVTRTTLDAISFPAFVSDLIKGTFNAIMDATVTQMQAFMELVENVSKTVTDFERENLDDGQAHQWLAQSFPRFLRLRMTETGPVAEPTDMADEEDLPDFRTALRLSEEVTYLDDDVVSSVLVPAARRKLAQGRLQMLSSMVMLGLQRIIIRRGRIRAAMGFQIDASDRDRQQSADLLDVGVAAKASGGMGLWSASVSTSVTYVRSSSRDRSGDIDVNANLTGEVDLTFETDYLPLNRLANDRQIETIRDNTPNPATNTPVAGPAANPSSSSSSGAGSLLQTHLQRRTAPTAPDLPNAAELVARRRAASEEENEDPPTENSPGAEEPTNDDAAPETPPSEEPV